MDLALGMRLAATCASFGDRPQCGAHSRQRSRSAVDSRRSAVDFRRSAVDSRRSAVDFHTALRSISPVFDRSAVRKHRTGVPQCGRVPPHYDCEFTILRICPTQQALDSSAPS